jgi:hypothetical protein
MIRANTGEFKLDDYDLLIHPELTEPQFQVGGIPVLKRHSSSETGWITYWFAGAIDGVKADFTICFKQGKLCLLSLEPKVGDKRDAWATVSGKAQKQFLDDWLIRVVGSPPPYEYEWGSFGSERDIHTGDFSVAVEFKYGLLDRGITNFKSYFEQRRKRLAQSC